MKALNFAIFLVLGSSNIAYALPDSDSKHLVTRAC